MALVESWQRQQKIVVSLASWLAFACITFDTDVAGTASVAIFLGARCISRNRMSAAAAAVG